MLVRMTHRGACGCEENTGDGAGILVAVPDGFLRKAAHEAGIGELPPKGEYAVGNIFVPKFENAVPEAKSIVERVCKQRGMKVCVCVFFICLLFYWVGVGWGYKLGKRLHGGMNLFSIEKNESRHVSREKSVVRKLFFCFAIYERYEFVFFWKK